MGFVYAFRGIKVGLTQRNMRVHVVAALVVIILGFLLKLSINEWIVVLILISVVWAAELFNTAIEEEANIMRDELGAPYRLMGKAKDLSAGGVLVVAICAAFIGLIIFVPKIITLF